MYAGDANAVSAAPEYQSFSVLTSKERWPYTDINMTIGMPTQGATIAMFDDFLWRAALAGIVVAFASGPLGCFVVWRRMAYFGDATAHAAILGVALSLGFSISIFIGVLITALAMAFMILSLSGRVFTVDTLLGVAAHGALAVGLVAVTFLPGVRVDLSAYLFGDILAVGHTDLLIISAGSVAILAALWLRWERLLLLTLVPIWLQREELTRAVRT